jgi:hypothetical protein
MLDLRKVLGIVQEGQATHWPSAAKPHPLRYWSVTQVVSHGRQLVVPLPGW